MIYDEVVEIPKGNIEFRDDRTKKKWTVEIEPFLLLKFPVTQKLYYKTTHENPNTFKGNLLPIETVTFIDAIKFYNILFSKFDLTTCYTIQNKPTR